MAKLEPACLRKLFSISVCYELIRCKDVGFLQGAAMADASAMKFLEAAHHCVCLLKWTHYNLLFDKCYLVCSHHSVIFTSQPAFRRLAWLLTCCNRAQIVSSVK